MHTGCFRALFMGTHVTPSSMALLFLGPGRELCCIILGLTFPSSWTLPRHTVLESEFLWTIYIWPPFVSFRFYHYFPWVYKLLILNLFFPCYLCITFWSCPHLCCNDVPDTLAFPFGCPTAKNMIMNLLIATICTRQFSGKCTHQCMSVQCLLKLCLSLFFKFSLSRFWWGRAVQCHLAYRILLPWWGIQPRSTAVKTLMS